MWSKRSSLWIRFFNDNEFVGLLQYDLNVEFELRSFFILFDLIMLIIMNLYSSIDMYMWSSFSIVSHWNQKKTFFWCWIEKYFYFANDENINGDIKNHLSFVSYSYSSSQIFI